MDANWYPDPQDPSLLRYWDGRQWTEHTHPADAATAQAAEQSTTNLGAPGEPAAGADMGHATTAQPAGHPGTGSAALPQSFANSTLFKDNLEAETTGRITRQNPAVIKVTLTGTPMMVSRGAMIAFQGDVTFAYQGSGAKRMLKSMATTEGVKLMRCEGTGELFVSHGGHKLHLLDLAEGESLSISSRSLLGFDATVDWDIEAIKAGMGAMVAGGLFNVRLTGPGTVILASDWPVVLNTSEARTLVDPNAVVAWSANLQVGVKTSMSAGALIGRGSGEAVQLEFSSGGFVIVEPEPVRGAPN